MGKKPKKVRQAMDPASGYEWITAVVTDGELTLESCYVGGAAETLYCPADVQGWTEDDVRDHARKVLAVPREYEHQIRVEYR